MILDVKNVKPGMKLAENVYLSEKNNSLTYLTAGTILTEEFIERLEKTNKQREKSDLIPVTELNIALTEEEMKELGLAEDFVYPTIDQKTVLEAKRKLLTLHSLNGASIKEIVQTAQIIASKILSSNSQFIYYFNDYVQDEERINHSIRTAIYSTVLAKAYNKDVEEPKKIDLKEIATAALLHDFGVVCKDDKVRESMEYYMPPGGNFNAFTMEKIRELKQNYNPFYNSYYSYCVLAGKEELSDSVKTMIALSSETENEKGPLKSKQVSSSLYKNSTSVNAAKIISLCSMYDDYLMKFIEEEDTLENVREALGSLEKENAFNSDLINLLVKNIPLYPIGTKVMLQGQYSGLAEVVDNYSTYSLWSRPKVKMCDSGIIVDLKTELKTIISNVYKNDFEATNVMDIMSEEGQEIKHAI